MDFFYCFILCFYAILGFLGTTQAVENSSSLFCYSCSPSHYGATACADPAKFKVPLVNCTTFATEDVSLLKFSCLSRYLYFENGPENGFNETGIYRSCAESPINDPFNNCFDSSDTNVTVLSCVTCETSKCNKHIFNEDGTLLIEGKNNTLNEKAENSTVSVFLNNTWNSNMYNDGNTHSNASINRNGPSHVEEGVLTSLEASDSVHVEEDGTKLENDNKNNTIASSHYAPGDIIVNTSGNITDNLAPQKNVNMHDLNSINATLIERHFILNSIIDDGNSSNIGVGNSSSIDFGNSSRIAFGNSSIISNATSVDNVTIIDTGYSNSSHVANSTVIVVGGIPGHGSNNTGTGSSSGGGHFGSFRPNKASTIVSSFYHYGILFCWVFIYFGYF